MLRTLAGALALLIMSLPAALAQTQPAAATGSGQAWPVKVVRIIVPFAPGSFTDIAARTLAAELTSQLGQTFVVENRTGAGGTIGTDAVAKAPADGYTLLVSDNSFVMAPGLYPKLPFDAARDFAHVSLIAESPSLLVARLNLPAKTVKELVELARAKPEALTFGSGGVGSSAHLATELFMSVTGTRMTHVPFKGIVLSIAEVAGDRIDTSIASLASGMAMVNAGKVQGLGVTGKERSPLLPTVPTFVEAGFPAYDMRYWWGIAAPAATSAAVVLRLNQEIVKAAEKPRVRDSFGKQGARAVTSMPWEIALRVDEEMKVWKNVIVKAGVRIE